MQSWRTKYASIRNLVVVAVIGYGVYELVRVLFGHTTDLKPALVQIAVAFGIIMLGLAHAWLIRSARYKFAFAVAELLFGQLLVQSQLSYLAEKKDTDFFFRWGIIAGGIAIVAKAVKDAIEADEMKKKKTDEQAES